MAVIGKEGKAPHFAVVIIDKAVIGAPVPVRNEHFITGLGIIVHHMMEHPCAAGGGAGIHITFGAGISKALVNAVIQEFPVPLDRCIGTDFLRRKLLQPFLHHVQHHQISILIKNGTHRTVDHLVIADFLSQGNGPVVGCKNIIFCTFSFCMRCCHTEHKKSSLK